MTNTEKALSLINSFTTGDTEIGKTLLTEGYIQHNLAYPTGRDGFVGAVEYLASAPVKTTLKNIRAFEDGDYVILHNQYNFAGAGEQVAFDVFRFEDGKIAEHWDNLLDIKPANPSGHTQIDGTTEIKDLDKTEENKELVKNFVKDILVGENPDKLTSYYDGDNYIQHNPDIADGLSGLGKALEYMAEQGIKMEYNKIHFAYGKGNFVLTISEGVFAGEPTSYYDLFRVENGKIAEHWDVMETISKEHKHDNGKF